MLHNNDTRSEQRSFDNNEDNDPETASDVAGQ